MDNNQEPVVPASTVVVAGLGEVEQIASWVIAEAVRMATVAPHATLHVVHVVDLLPGAEAAVRNNAWEHPGAAALRKKAEHHLQLFAEIAERALGRPVQRHLAFGGPAKRLLELAITLSSDYLVVGPLDRSAWQRAVFGSTAEDVLRRAPCSVILARPKHA